MDATCEKYESNGWVRIEGEYMLPNDESCLYEARHQDGQLPFNKMITLSEIRPLYSSKTITEYRTVIPCKPLTTTPDRAIT